MSHRSQKLRQVFLAERSKLIHIPFWFFLSVVHSPLVLLLATSLLSPLWVCCLLLCLLKAEIERLVCQVTILCKYIFIYCINILHFVKYLRCLHRLWHCLHHPLHHCPSPLSPVKNDRRSSGGTIRQKFNIIASHIQFFDI